MNSALIHWHGVEAADSFLCMVRQLRYSGVETLVMTEVDFEQMILSWPEFYLGGGPVVQPKESWPWKVLRKIFGKPRLAVRLRFSDQGVKDLTAQFRRLKAIPVDGCWFPVRFWIEWREQAGD